MQNLAVDFDFEHLRALSELEKEVADDLAPYREELAALEAKYADELTLAREVKADVAAARAEFHAAYAASHEHWERLCADGQDVDEPRVPAGFGLRVLREPQVADISKVPHQYIQLDTKAWRQAVSSNLIPPGTKAVPKYSIIVKGK